MADHQIPLTGPAGTAPLSSRPGLRVTVELSVAASEILNPSASGFLVELSRAFEGRRADLLERRRKRQADLDGGALPISSRRTRSIRESEWRVRADSR